MTTEAPAHKKRSPVTLILGIVATVLFVGGVIFHLTQLGTLERIYENVLVRPGGPFGARFILQPVVAAIIGVIDGIEDARHGRPHFWSVIGDKDKRWDALMEGLSAVANVIFLAVILDTLYQLIVTRTFYWGETVIVALLLAFVPYIIVRGPAATIARPLVTRRGGRGTR